jgi:hypothetical protein
MPAGPFSFLLKNSDDDLEILYQSGGEVEVGKFQG